MPRDIEVKPLVKGLGPQQIGGGTGGGFKTFVLPPHGHHIISPGDNCAFPHIKTIFDTIVLDYSAIHLQAQVCGAARGFGPVVQVGHHIRREVGIP